MVAQEKKVREIKSHKAYSNNPMPLRSTGFTLVELLVVISIISLLMGILLPALSRARGVAKKIKCASRIRQIGLAFELYSATQDGWILTAVDPRLTIDGQSAWNFALLPYVCEKRTGGFDSAEIWFCPEDKDPFPLGYGSYPHEVGLTSYALNGYYAEARAARPPRPATPKAQLGPAGHFKNFQIWTPSGCMLMVETSHSGQVYDAACSKAEQYGLCTSDRSHHRMTSGFYHHNSMNILFVDGHVGNIKGRRSEPWAIYFTSGWLSSNMFWDDLSLPDSTEDPVLWGPDY